MRDCRPNGQQSGPASAAQKFHPASPLLQTQTPARKNDAAYKYYLHVLHDSECNWMLGPCFLSTDHFICYPPKFPTWFSAFQRQNIELDKNILSLWRAQEGMFHYNVHRSWKKVKHILGTVLVELSSVEWLWSSDILDPRSALFCDASRQHGRPINMGSVFVFFLATLQVQRQHQISAQWTYSLNRPTSINCLPSDFSRPFNTGSLLRQCMIETNSSRVQWPG